MLPDQDSAIFAFDGLVLKAGLHELGARLPSGESVTTAILVEDVELALNIAGFFSEVTPQGLAPMVAPTPGSTARARIAQPDTLPQRVFAELLIDGEIHDLDAEIDWAATDASAGSNLAIAFTLPLNVRPGHGYLRLSLDDRHSAWTQFEVADPEFTNLRAALAEGLLSELQTTGTQLLKPALVGPWNVLPVGGEVRDSLSDAVHFEIQSPASFLFYYVDRVDGIEQPGGHWYVLDQHGTHLAEGYDADGSPMSIILTARWRSKVTASAS